MNAGFGLKSSYIPPVSMVPHGSQIKACENRTMGSGAHSSTQNPPQIFLKGPLDTQKGRLNLVHFLANIWCRQHEIFIFLKQDMFFHTNISCNTECEPLPQPQNSVNRQRNSNPQLHNVSTQQIIRQSATDSIYKHNAPKHFRAPFVLCIKL